MISLEEFLAASPSPFHAVKTAVKMLTTAGFQLCKETSGLPQDKPSVYTRDSVSFCAYIPGTSFESGFSSVQTHVDSPVIRLLQNGSIAKMGSFVSVPCEPYSGPVLSRWLDRPLQLAGRVAYFDNGKVKFSYVHRRDAAFIPSLAPHMLRGTDKTDWVPADAEHCVCIADAELMKCETIEALARKLADIPAGAQITAISIEASAQDISKMGQIIMAPRLDNLASVYASIVAIIVELQKPKAEHTRMIMGFNNEEVGSQTRAGAQGPCVLHWWRALSRLPEAQICSSLARSIVASADGAHGKHPIKGAGSCNDPVPVLGSGFCMKYGQKQNYAFTDHTLSVAKAVCLESKIPFQNWIGRSYKMGGGTIGNIVAADSDLNVFDCGAPMLAMHSCIETADLTDLANFAKFMEHFLASGVALLAQTHDEMNE